MSLQTALEFAFEFGDRPIQVEVSQSPLSSDAGLLIFRQMDERLRYTQQFADALWGDSRVGPTHSWLDMVRQRVYGMLADYEDQNDHDALRSDPIFKVITGRDPTDPKQDLASQPTLSRFENAVSIADLNRLRELFVTLFIQSFRESLGGVPPRRITLDLDAWDDETHGQQQLSLFHGYYDQYQYYPLSITCAENDQLVMVGLRHGTAPAFLGADDDVRYIVERLRAVWPDIEIRVRADSGFGVPLMLDVCEELRLIYTFGYGMNPVLNRHTEELRQQLQRQFAEASQPQREFVCWPYQARHWSAPRCTIVKVEVNSEGTNRRVVLTNRPGGAILPGATYDEYADRGESENRHKELKRELHGDRLSDHRFMANYFRLLMHGLAYNLLVRQRQWIADPPAPAPEVSADSPPRLVPAAEALPAEALPGQRRRRYFNARRREDPLGEGHISTWRTHIIKVAAEVVVSTRRIVIRLSASWPYLKLFLRVAQANATLATT